MNPFHIIPQERVARGQPIRAEGWNNVTEAIESLQILGVQGQLVGEAPTGVMLFRELLFKQFPAGKLDYYEAYDPADGTSKTAIFVAKPFGLRPSLASHGGSSFTYSTDIARVADSTEDQVIVPAFDADDPVVVIGPMSTGVVDGSSNEVLWLDLNVWARGWAADA